LLCFAASAADDDGGRGGGGDGYDGSVPKKNKKPIL
jgi:hypothetical protein